MGVLMSVDGVLRNPINNAPIREGFYLYHLLKSQTKVVFLCDDRAFTDTFLRTNKIINFDAIESTEDLAPGDDVMLRLIKRQRAQGAVEYVVTADLDLVTPLLEAGIATLAFCIPSYLDHKFMPDSRQGKKTWGEITSEIERQQDMLAQDGRL